MWIEVQVFHYQYTIYHYAHTVSFYFPVFVISVLLIKVITRERVMKIANTMCWGFFLLPAAPLLDHFVLNRAYGYDYMPNEAFLKVFLTFLPTETAGVFQTLILILLLLLACVYVYIKTRSVSKAVVTLFAFWIVMVVVSIPYVNPLLTPGQTPNTIFFVYYVILTGIFLLVLLKVSRNNLVTSLLKSLRPFPLLHGCIMVILGLIIAGNLNMADVLKFPFTNTFGFVCLSVFAVVFAWCFTVLLNHVYDIEIDRISGERRITTEDLLPSNQVKHIAVVCGLLAVLFAVLLGYLVVLLILVALLLGTLYSVPPIRLRNTLFSSLFIGAGSVIEFLVGVTTPPFYWSSAGLQLGTVMLPFMVFPVTLILFIAFSVGTVVKDLKNYEGDLKAGVKNIFTMYGLETGVRIASIALCISFLIPLVVFHEAVDFFVIIPVGFLTVFLFYKFKNVGLPFGIYFILFLYLLLRYVKLI